MRKIDINTWNRKSSYLYFSKFANPCYGFDVEMDITKLYALTKQRHQSFFINFLYIVTYGLNQIEEMRMRIINDEVVVYDVINPTYTVMTKAGCFENCGHKMTYDYQEFYKRTQDAVEKAKNQTKIKDGYNDDNTYQDFYMTCIPWLSYKSMTHPLPDNEPSSSSCPRVCWGKYYFDGDKVKVLLNITVSHAVCDGYPLSQAFLKIQEMLDDVEKYL